MIPFWASTKHELKQLCESSLSTQENSSQGCLRIDSLKRPLNRRLELLPLKNKLFLSLKRIIYLRLDGYNNNDISLFRSFRKFINLLLITPPLIYSATDETASLTRVIN